MTLSVHSCHGQGRSQEFFQGKAPGGGFNGGLPGAPGEGSPTFFNFQGEGSIPIFGCLNGQNERVSRSGGMAPFSMPAYAYHGDSIVLYITEKQLYTFSLGIDCKVLVKLVGNR